MNGPLDNESTWTEEQRLAKTTVAGLRRPDADPAFRDRLRDAFVSGALVDGAEDVRAHARRPSPAPGRTLRRRGSWQWAISLVVAASLVLMITLANRGDRWSVEDHEGLDYIVLDGEMISCADLSPVEAALHPGCRVDVPEGGSLALASAGAVAMELGEGVAFTLPRPPGRWFGRDIESNLIGDGVVRIATADEFEGSTYRIKAGGLEFAIRGSAVSVDRRGDEIEVSILEGKVWLVGDHSDSESESGLLPAGMRSRLNVRGDRIGAVELDPVEGARLASLRDRATAI